MAGSVGSEQSIQRRYEGLSPVLNEQGLRLLAAAEARAYGHGGVSVVARRSFKTIVQLIAATTTTTGLTVRAELDEGKYPRGVKISDAKFATVNIARHPFHGDWNYTISPKA